MLSEFVDYNEHEAVVFACDKASGLQAIIAIHDTTLGPAHGGTRAWHYATEAEAVTDALRLSQGMTFKNAVAGLPLGGGKSVILLQKGQKPTPAALHAFGRAVDMLGGRYLPAEDVGIGPDAVQEIARETTHVLGIDKGGADAADPSPLTALGVFSGMIEMMRRVQGRSDLAGTRVAIQGLGGVGANLARLVHDAGGALIVADLDPRRSASAAKDFDAQVVPVKAIHAVSADVFAPCALGAVLNTRTISELGAGIICGGANNQIADDVSGRALFEKCIAYAPDFVVNAGGVMWTSAPITGLSRKEVETRVQAIGRTLGTILDAQAADETAQDAAVRYARSLLAQA